MSINFDHHHKSIKSMENEWIKYCKSLLRNCLERGNEYFEGDMNIIKYLILVSS